MQLQENDNTKNLEKKAIALIVLIVIAGFVAWFFFAGNKLLGQESQTNVLSNAQNNGLNDQMQIQGQESQPKQNNSGASANQTVNVIQESGISQNENVLPKQTTTEAIVPARTSEFWQEQNELEEADQALPARLSCADLEGKICQQGTTCTISLQATNDTDKCCFGECS